MWTESAVSVVVAGTTCRVWKVAMKQSVALEVEYLCLLFFVRCNAFVSNRPNSVAAVSFRDEKRLGKRQIQNIDRIAAADTYCLIQV